MRFLASLLLLGLGILTGCGGDASSPPQEPTPRPLRNLKSYHAPPIPAFRGEPAKSLVKWDLSGIWTVSRISSSGQPGKAAPWEARWRLRKVRNPAQLTWEDEYAKATFVLTERLPQMLIWGHDGTTTYLSINEHAPGLLVMTGNDGERYQAVRMDPNANPAPPETEGE
jgi:hypothetical protein